MILLATTVLASEGDEDITNWNKTFGGAGFESINVIVEDSQGYLYFGGQGGNLISSISGPDWWVKKFDKKGNEDLSWNKSFSNRNSAHEERIDHMAVDSNDNIYMVGDTFNSTPPSSSYDGWIKKLNRSGTEDAVNWNKTFTSSGSGIDDFLAVAIDSNNNIYIGGAGFNFSGNNVDDWVIKKYNSSGTEDTTNWNKTYKAGASANQGKIDSNDNLYVVGAALNLVSANSNQDWWIKKFNSSGTEDTVNWNKTFGGVSIDSAVDITYDARNNIYVSGYGGNLASATSSFDWWIKKFNSSGTEDTTLWNKNYSSQGESVDVLIASHIDSTGKTLFVAGYGVTADGDWWIKSFETSTLLNAPLISSPLPFQNFSGNIILNASIVLNATHGANVVNMTFHWQLTSTMAFVLNTTVYNTTANQTSFANTSFNTLLLADGIYNLTATAVNASSTESDTALNIINITIDNTAPVISSLAASEIGATSAKLTVIINEPAANCTFASVAGTQGNAGSGNFATATAGVHTTHTKTFSSLTAGTGYQIEVTCTDFAGNTVTRGTSWSTSAAAAAASNGGSGSGGSSGGISTGVQGSFEKKVWTSINAGETASVALKNGVLGITELSFSVPNTVYGAWVHIAKKESLPSSVSAFSGEAYRIIEITKGPALAKAGAYTDAALKFKVEKAWLAEQQLTKEGVALHHYENGVWTQLETTVDEDDGTYVHYSAKTPGFSYFVIGEKAKEKKAEPTPVTEISTEKKELPEAEALVGMDAKADLKQETAGQNAALISLTVVITLIILLSYTKRRKKRK